MSSRRRRKGSGNWLRQIVRWMDACESEMPEPAFLKGHWPEWVRRIGRELMATMFPAAKLKVGRDWTAGELGALLGHRVAYFHAMTHFAVPETSDVFKKLDNKVVRQTQKQLQDYANAFDVALKRSLALAVDQSHADAAQFFTSFAKGLNKMPSDIQASNFQRSTTRVYCIMLAAWRSVERLKSVHELQQGLCRHMDTHAVGNVKRIEKICQRIGLSFGLPGRPKKIRQP